MQRLLLNSIWIAMVALPVIAARERNPQRGAKKALLLVLAYNVFYLFCLEFVIPHLD